MQKKLSIHQNQEKHTTPKLTKVRNGHAPLQASKGKEKCNKAPV